MTDVRRILLGIGATAVVAGVVTVIVVMSGGGGHSTRRLRVVAGRHVARSVGNGYLAATDREVDYIQWTDNHGVLDGTAQVVLTQGTPPDASTTNKTLSVSGTINGTALSVSFDSTPDTFGTIRGDTFTLEFPQSTGGLVATTFHATDTATFNAAVAKLQAQVSRTNEAVTAAQDRANSEQAIDSDAQTVASDLTTLSQDGATLGGELPTISGKLAQQADDLATESPWV